MPSTLQADLIFRNPGPKMPESPPDYTAPSQESFDWNGDGLPDRLTIGDPAGSVGVFWAGGSITVTGVETQFAGPVTDRQGRIHQVLTRAADVKLAAVADVTGDGLLDLIVTNQGDVAVLTGSGGNTAGGSYTFSELGVSTLGWQNPPSDILNAQDPLPGTEGMSITVPTPISAIQIVGDVTSDGVTDFAVAAILERGTGAVVFYAGTPCTAG